MTNSTPVYPFFNDVKCNALGWIDIQLVVEKSMECVVRIVHGCMRCKSTIRSLTVLPWPHAHTYISKLMAHYRHLMFKSKPYDSPELANQKVKTNSNTALIPIPGMSSQCAQGRIQDLGAGGEAR